jgi:tetratricopeptide (TPR) repeat protein
MAAVTEARQEQEQQKQEQQRLQALFNKGFAAFERGNLDMAIELLFNCIEAGPGFLRARKFLRAAEIQRLRKGGQSKLGAQLAQVTGLPGYLKTLALLKTGKGEQALLAAEGLLRRAPLTTKFVILAADAAVAAGQTDAALMTLETALEQAPEDVDILRRLGHAYEQVEQWRKARDCYNTLINLRPHDAGLMKLLKDAEAHVSMSGSWDSMGGEGEKDGFRKLIKDQKAAASLDMQNKAIVGGEDAVDLIAEQKAKIAAEPKNINFYRGLARLYTQQKQFDEAVATLEQARLLNPSDPELDRTLTGAKVQAYGARIAAAEAAGQAAAAEALTHERNQFVFDDLVQRVERYPNDLRLRFELGQQYYQYESYDDAIQQFQMAQRSPKERNEALYYLARCFRAKGQKDMALMQLETAIEQLPVMDDMRKQVLFELGELREEAGELDKAFEHYKEIYGADIGYRDIGAKMERMYKRRKA